MAHRVQLKHRMARAGLTAPGGLPPREALFIERYLVHFNQGRAALEAGWTESQCHAQGSWLVRQPRIRERIGEELLRMRDQARIHRDDVARYWLDIAYADVSELLPFRRGSCRHCHGIDHQHQMTLVEYRYRVNQHRMYWQKMLRTMPPGSEPPMFDEMGGTGYDQTRPPNPDCPECHGLGILYPCPPDVDKLSRGARLALESVDVARDGTIRVKIRDRSRAMENFQQLLGFVKPKRAMWDFSFDDMTDEQLDALLGEAQSRGLITEADIEEERRAAMAKNVTPAAAGSERVS